MTGRKKLGLEMQCTTPKQQNQTREGWTNCRTMDTMMNVFREFCGYFFVNGQILTPSFKKYGFLPVKIQRMIQGINLKIQSTCIGKLTGVTMSNHDSLYTAVKTGLILESEAEKSTI
jgi:hypothetical protein